MSVPLHTEWRVAVEHDTIEFHIFMESRVGPGGFFERDLAFNAMFANSERGVRDKITIAKDWIAKAERIQLEADALRNTIDDPMVDVR